LDGGGELGTRCEQKFKKWPDICIKSKFENNDVPVVVKYYEVVASSCVTDVT